jgi:hypothetical protein
MLNITTSKTRLKLAILKNSSFSLATRRQQGSHRDPEVPAAHVSVCLALLPSGPDAVRRLRLHRFRAAARPTGLVRDLSIVASVECTPRATSEQDCRRVCLNHIRLPRMSCLDPGVTLARRDPMLRQLPVERFSVQAEHPCGRSLIARDGPKGSNDMFAFDIRQSAARAAARA